MSRIRLKYLNTQSLENNPEIAIIVLTDENEERQLAVFCDNLTKENIDLRCGKVFSADVEQGIVSLNTVPFTEKLLPEVLCKAIKYLTGIQLSVVITHVMQGTYYSHIEDIRTGTTFPIKTSEGILLCVADKHVPLYIEEELWNRQSNPYKKDAAGIAIPINAITYEMLVTSMNKAIENEDYEIAQKFKEEIDRRNKGGKDGLNF